MTAAANITSRARCITHLNSATIRDDQDHRWRAMSSPIDYDVVSKASIRSIGLQLLQLPKMRSQMADDHCRCGFKMSSL
jgi:hypothetical protein